MDFRNANSLNDRMNLLSGNLLPIVTGDSAFPLIWRVYSVIVWLIELVHTVALILAFIITPLQKAMKDGTVCMMVIVEVSFILTRLYTCRKILERIVVKMNDILSDADETMKYMIQSTLRPMMKAYTVHSLISGSTILIWTIQPVTFAFDKDAFLYVDYNLPCVFSTEPFSRVVLIASSTFMTIGSLLLFLKKCNVDVYMMHLVLMLTAQYRYTAKKLMLLFRDLHEDSCDKVTNRRVERELRTLCQHHNTILRISFMLRKLLSVNFSLLYMNSVLRFCCIGFLMSTIPSLSLTEGLSIVLYSLSSVTQFFLLCFCVQTLSDASTEMTDKAFDEGWYQCDPSMKLIFLLLIMANQLECKITAVEKFGLSLPSFMTIMNQSYSIALLFLRTN